MTDFESRCLNPVQGAGLLTHHPACSTDDASPPPLLQAWAELQVDQLLQTQQGQQQAQDEGPTPQQTP